MPLQGVTEKLHQADSNREVIQQTGSPNTKMGMQQKNKVSDHMIPVNDMNLPDVEKIPNGVIIKSNKIQVIVKAIEEHLGTGINSSEAIEFSYGFEVWNGSRRTEVQVDWRELGSTKWLNRALRGLLFLEPDTAEEFRKMLIEAIQESDVDTTYCFQNNGWQKVQNRWMYILDKGIVGDPAFMVRGNPEYKFPEVYPSNLAELFGSVMGMLHICCDTSVMLVLMLYSMASFISALFEEAGYPLKFLLTLIGETNSKKTTLAMLVCKIFNRKNANPDANFVATAAGIRDLVQEHADQVLIVDDIRPNVTAARAKEQAEKLEELSVLYGDRVMKKFGRGYRKDEKVMIRGGCVITGEQITGAESSYARRIQLSLARGDVNEVILSQYQQKDIWPTFIYNFLIYVTQNSGKLIELISYRVSRMRNDMNFRLDRRNEQFAQLAVMAEIMLDFGSFCKAVEENEKSQLLQDFVGQIVGVVHQNKRITMELNPTLLIVRALAEELNENNAFALSSSPADSKKIYVDDAFVYVSKTKLHQIIEAYAELQNQTVVDIGNVITDLLEQEGLLFIRTEGDKRRRTHKLPGATNGTRFLCIKRQKMESFLQKNER